MQKEQDQSTKHRMHSQGVGVAEKKIGAAMKYPQGILKRQNSNAALW